MKKLETPRLGLSQWPETQNEYLEVINRLTLERINVRIYLGDSEPDARGKKHLEAIESLMNAFYDDLEEKFGVVSPARTPIADPHEGLPPLPNGKVYYHQWEESIVTRNLETKYSNMVCSACPFSKGFDWYRNAVNKEDICDLYGKPYRFHGLVDCAMVGPSMDRESLFEMIEVKFGQETGNAVRQKYADLLERIPTDLP